MENFETEHSENLELRTHHLMYKSNGNSKRGPRSHKKYFSRVHKQFEGRSQVSMQVPCELLHYHNVGAPQGIIYKGQHVATQGSYSLHQHHVPLAQEQQEYNCMKMHRINNVSNSDTSFCASVYDPSLRRSVGCNEYKLRRNLIPGTRAKKWVPTTDQELRVKSVGSAGGCDVFNSTLSVPASLHSKPYSGSDVCDKHKLTKGIKAGTKANKWIHIHMGMDESRVNRTGLAGGRTVFGDNLPSSCGAGNEGRSKGKVPSVCGSATSIGSEATKSEGVSGTEEVHVTENSEDRMTYGKEPQGPPQLNIGLKMAALDAAYKLQVESERIQLARGFPLADFETFIRSAAPVIFSSQISEQCAVCSDSQLSCCSFRKQQMTSISLLDVWNWYEKPSNYGLEVKGMDYGHQDRQPTEFHAYFVPLLSAVQLVGNKRLDKQEVELNSSPETIDAISRGNGTSLLSHEYIEEASISKTSPLFCPSDADIIFEFFESEQPHQRKPLHLKIFELIAAGNSSPQVNGDPSKLQSLKLHDLHPASWYSVAWYPIYQIPGGKFRASFLTYHSLGHLVQNDSDDKRATCIISPVVGLQSYNAEGECWFDPRMPLNSPPFSSSFEIVREQLKSLEENALHFARGGVFKSNAKVFNRQPDYEFFLSRKRRVASS